MGFPVVNDYLSLLAIAVSERYLVRNDTSIFSYTFTCLKAQGADPIHASTY